MHRVYRVHINNLLDYIFDKYQIFLSYSHSNSIAIYSTELIDAIDLW